MTKQTMRPSIDHSILSPSGRVSKRARKAALEQQAKILFAGIDFSPSVPQPTEAEALRRQAKQLLELANRGMNTKSYRRHANKLIARAEQLERG